MLVSKSDYPKEQAYFWTREVQQEIKRSEEDLKAGRYKDYDDFGSRRLQPA